MSKKLIAVAAVLAALLSGAAFVGAWPAAKAGDCCYPGSECCFPGSPCCGDCCYEGSPCCDPPQACCLAASAVAKTRAGCCEPGAECCFPGSPCCGDDCCYPGSPCCYPGSPCCGDCCFDGSPCCDPPQACCLAVSAVAKAEHKGGCCATADKGKKAAGCCVKVAQAKACCCQAVAKGDKPAQAADKKLAAGTTVIAVEDMECPSCAKKIVAKLNEVAGVAKAEADVKTSKLTVAAKDGASPSAKAMWEAVEKAGFKPTKLEGPGGTFTAKPKE